MPWNTAVSDSQLVAIHAALLPSEPEGVVVYYGDWSGGGGGVGVQDVTHTRLHHIGSNTLSDIPMDVLPDTDVFCAGQAFLADGRLLTAGGTYGWANTHDGIHETHYDGERACWIYLPNAQAWTQISDLNYQPGNDAQGGGRWYPTLVTLENNQVFTAGGHPRATDYYPPTDPQRHNNNTPEIYSPGSDTWTLLTNDITCPPTVVNDSYPRYHLLPDGRLFSDTAGNDNGNGSESAKRIFNPFNGAWEGPDIAGLSDLPGFYDRGSEATSVLLPLVPPHYRPRILAVNSGTPTAWRIDVNESPTWVETTPRTGSAAGRARDNGCATLLPTGQVLVTGGWPGNYANANDLDDATLEPELYTPGIDWSTGGFTGTENWATIEEPASRRRGYHSTALLLPDGRVWVGGSTTVSEMMNFEIETFEPDYIADTNRPTITAAPTNIGYGMNFEVETPQADSITGVVLIRNGSITHGFNSDQRYVSLNFAVGNNNRLNVQSPPSGRIAPPGYYMLWIIDDNERPCALASFIRVSKQKLMVSSDISTFSIHEVEALGPPATFTAALYVAADGFLAQEVSTPSLELLLPNNEPVPGVTINMGQPKYEAGSQNQDVAQRVVYPINLTFHSTAAFDEIPEDQDFLGMSLFARMDEFIGVANLTLSKNPNPRMRDGDPPYLSIDLRVFKTNPGEMPTAEIPHPESAAGAYKYIQDVIDAHNEWTGGNHPFDDLPQDLDMNRLDLASTDVNGDPVFNYALARVRFRAPEGISAADVRVFFRMWTTGWTALEYSLNGSYRRAGNGPSAAPLLGLEGDEINNIPCFAQERSANMENQSDSKNRLTLNGLGATEVFGYFGCWLDVNQDVARFPLKPGHNGPFDDSDDPDGLRSIQELMRGLHQCLVAEIHYTLDPISGGSTPGSSDNLAQRNILFDDSDNPGGFASHLVHHTFELKPSPFSFEQAASIAEGSATSLTRLNPDELVLDWGNLPRDSLVTFYMPQVDAKTILAASGLRQAPAHLRSPNNDTVTFKVSDVGFMPIPGPFETAIAGLMSVQLPPGVPEGATYKVVMRQVSGRSFKVLGTTEFRINVKTAAEILPRSLHSLSVLRHVGASIPPDNRWHPVFERYIGELEGRVIGLGGDPDDAVPSSTGHPNGGDPGDKDSQDHDDANCKDEMRACFSGRVKRLIYGCFGEFKGFILYSCDGEIELKSHEPGIERLLLKACEYGMWVNVFYETKTKRPKKMTLDCGVWDDGCPDAEPKSAELTLTRRPQLREATAAQLHAERVRAIRARTPRRPTGGGAHNH